MIVTVLCHRFQLYRLGGVDIEKAFKNFDHDNSNALEMDEFLLVLRMHAKISTREISDEQLKCVFHAVDTDHSGTIDIDEFTSWVAREMEEAMAPPEAEEALRLKLQVLIFRNTMSHRVASVSIHTKAFVLLLTSQCTIPS